MSSPAPRRLRLPFWMTATLFLFWIAWDTLLDTARRRLKRLLGRFAKSNR
jgi:hypothetical protein